MLLVLAVPGIKDMGGISVKVHWGRIFFVIGLLLLIASFLWLRQNAGAVHDTWRSFEYELSHFSGRDALQVCFYLALGLGVLMTILWLASCVARWFRR